MREIISQRLWIGPTADVNSLREFLADNGRAIVQLAYEEAPVSVPREIVNCRFPIVDGDGNDPTLLQLAVNCVATLLGKQVPTLVTCSAGMSRSPAIVAAAFSIANQQSLQESLEEVSRFGRLDVSPGLLREVSDLMPTLWIQTSRNVFGP